jgi:hypothetical protein
VISPLAGLLAVTLLALPQANPPLCESPNGFELAGTPPGPTLGIKLFGLGLKPDVALNRLEELRVLVAEEFRRRLSESRFFKDVRILPEDKEPDTDLVLTGEIVEFVRGTNSFGWAATITSGAVEEPAVVGLRGAVTRPGTAEAATTFVCGAAGLVGTVEQKTRRSASAIARYIGDTYSRMRSESEKKRKRTKTR